MHMVNLCGESKRKQASAAVLGHLKDSRGPITGLSRQMARRTSLARCRQLSAVAWRALELLDSFLTLYLLSYLILFNYI